MTEATSAGSQMVGKITRDDLYEEMCLLHGLLQATVELMNQTEPPLNNGLFPVACLAERMADDLAAKVSP